MGNNSAIGNEQEITFCCAINCIECEKMRKFHEHVPGHVYHFILNWQLQSTADIRDVDIRYERRSNRWNARDLCIWLSFGKSIVFAQV